MAAGVRCSVALVRGGRAGPRCRGLGGEHARGVTTAQLVSQVQGQATLRRWPGTAPGPAPPALRPVVAVALPACADVLPYASAQRRPAPHSCQLLPRHRRLMLPCTRECAREMTCGTPGTCGACCLAGMLAHVQAVAPTNRSGAPGTRNQRAVNRPDERGSLPTP